MVAGVVVVAGVAVSCWVGFGRGWVVPEGMGTGIEKWWVGGDFGGFGCNRWWVCLGLVYFLRFWWWVDVGLGFWEGLVIKVWVFAGKSLVSMLGR